MTLDDLAEMELNMGTDREWKRKCAWFVARCYTPGDGSPEEWWEHYDEWLDAIGHLSGCIDNGTALFGSCHKDGERAFIVLRRNGEPLAPYPHRKWGLWKHYVLAVTAAFVVTEGAIECVCG